MHFCFSLVVVAMRGFSWKLPSSFGISNLDIYLLGNTEQSAINILVFQERPNDWYETHLSRQWFWGSEIPLPFVTSSDKQNVLPGSPQGWKILSYVDLKNNVTGDNGLENMKGTVPNAVHVFVGTQKILVNYPISYIFFTTIFIVKNTCITIFPKIIKFHEDCIIAFNHVPN
jgi:hypothetical protein